MRRVLMPLCGEPAPPSDGALHPSAPPAWSLQDSGALCALLAAGLAVRLYGFGGMQGSDDLSYVQRAIALARGEYIQTLYAFDTRVALWAPVALLYRWFGVQELTTSLLPLVSGIGTIGLITILGRQLLGPYAGWIAGVLYAVLPIEVHLSTTLFPEAPMSFWITLAAVLMLRVSSCPGRRAALLALAAGLSLGLAWLTKEASVYAAAALVVAWRWRGERRKGVLTANIVGLATVIAAEGAFYGFTQHDPLFRFHAVQNTYEVSDQWFVQPWPRAGDLVWRWFGNVWVTLLTTPGFGAQFWLALPAMGALWLELQKGTGSREARFLVTWFSVLLLLFLFGSTSLREYRPLSIAPRYLALLDVPATLLAATWFRHPMIRDRRMSRREISVWAGGVLVLAVASIASFVVPEMLIALAGSAYGLIGEPRGSWVALLPRISEYVPYPRSIIVIAVVAWSAITLRWNRRWQLIALIALITVHLSLMKRDPLPAAERQTAVFLAQHPGPRVLTDYRTAQVLDYLTGFRDSTRFVEWPSVLDSPTYGKRHTEVAFRPPPRAQSAATGELVVFSPTRCEFLARAYGYVIPPAVESPSADLRRVYSARDRITVFEVARPVEW